MKKISRSLAVILLVPSLVFGQVTENTNSLDSQFANPTNLTDKQMSDAKDFVHKGIKDRTIKEKCAAVNDCKDDEGFPLEMLIGKAYSLIGMFSGSGMMPELTVKKPNSGTPGGSDASNANPTSATPSGATSDAGAVANGASGEAAGAAKDGTKKEKDHCMMISMAYEAVGTMIQQALQKRAEGKTVPGDEQLQALVSLQETHKAREKTARYQSYIYGGVTVCYAAKLATGAVADTSFVLKMGGAAALTGLFMKKANKHKKAANKVGEVISSLDWAGKNCNPWTKSACFCSEKTSRDLYPSEFQEICVLNNGNFDTPKVALGCTTMADNKMQFDKECKCKATNSCMKSPLRAVFPKYAMGNNLMAEANKTFELLNNGEMDQGQLDRASIQASALANRMKLKGDSKIKSPPLTAEQKKAADELKKFMPENAAAAAASLPVSKKAEQFGSGPGPSAISKLSESLKDQLADAIDAGYKTGGSGSSYSDRGESDFEMPVMPGMEKSQEEGTEVVTFAEKAISKADVSNAPSTPIFDIISNRYRRSGWSKLDTEGK